MANHYLDKDWLAGSPFAQLWQDMGATAGSQLDALGGMGLGCGLAQQQADFGQQAAMAQQQFGVQQGLSQQQWNNRQQLAGAQFDAIQQLRAANGGLGIGGPALKIPERKPIPWRRWWQTFRRRLGCWAFCFEPWKCVKHG